jgi:RNA polymerase sigma-70 factor (ECF subfamily)
VVRVALNVIGSQAAAQQIYCQVFRDAFVSVNDLRSGSSVFLWVYRILVRECLEHCRRHPCILRTDCSQGDFTCCIYNAFYSLPDIERVIFQLKHYQRLKVRTLAEIFNTTPEFVIKRLQRANAHLRRQLKSDPRNRLPT